MDTKKIDDNTIQITSTIPQSTVTNTYTVDQLLRQRDAIQAQKDADNAKRDAELEEVNALLAQASAVGIAVPAEPAPRPVSIGGAPITP